jgi:dienelactone hydrolase
MKERFVTFGPGKSLSGILTEPAWAAAQRPAVLLLNAGLLHHVGPNRLYVTLARRLAAAGLPVLRFDYSGLGESEPRRDEVPLVEGMIGEGIAAMDFLTASGVADRFVPMGLCAGAENAQRLARDDARVVGAALIDGYAYRTRRYHLRKLMRHVASARSWGRLFAKPAALLRASRRALPAAASERNPGGVDFVREFPPRETCLEELQMILAREVDLFFVFTGGGMAEFYNHPRQFFETFPELRGHPRVRLEFMSRADHTFTLRAQQEALLASIEGWVATTQLGVVATSTEAAAP